MNPSTLDALIANESERRAAFPCASRGIFMAHAGVAPLPQAAADAINAYVERAARDGQEFGAAWEIVEDTRTRAARLIGAQPDEISLLGPTSLGLGLIARGLDWAPGDEVVFNAGDYPANVYPWRDLERLGVKPVPLRPPRPGLIDWDLVESALTGRTKLVALASCHYLGGYRIDVRGIGERLRERGVLFALDAIQTLGAFPTPAEQVDFMAADAHKWMLGPAGAGIFYVKAERRKDLRPALLGAWNVHSPEFVAQEDIRFETGGRRYEPGTLNLAGIHGMHAALALLEDFGPSEIAARLLHLRAFFLEQVRPRGYVLCLEDWENSSAASDAARSAIISLSHPRHDMAEAAARLKAAGVLASLRHEASGEPWLRFSPHCYNTEDEIAHAAALLP